MKGSLTFYMIYIKEVRTMNNKFLQKLLSLSQSKYVRIITNSFMSIAAINIAGSIFMLIGSFPINAWQEFLVTSGLKEILAIPVSITTDLMALYVVLAIGYTVAKEFKEDAFGAAIVALGAFMILTPFNETQRSLNAAGEVVSQFVQNIIPVSSIGARGIFLALFAGLIAARLYVLFLQKGFKLKMPESVPENVSKMFEMMIPGGLVFLIFLGIRWGFSITSYGTAQSFIYTIVQQPLISVGGGLVGALVYVTVTQVLWGMGIHGGLVAYSAFAVIYKTVLTENIAAYSVGQAAPHPEWAWVTVISAFCMIALTIVMLLFARSKQYKILGKLSLPTSIFNIGEPLTFGIPIVMNPVMVIPHIITNPLNLLLTVLMSKIGFLAMPTGATANNMLPGPIQMAFVNSHWSGFVWGCILIVINMAIWYPFFKIIDNRAKQQELDSVAE